MVDLAILLEGKHVADLHSTGYEHSITYRDSSAAQTPLSLSMPVAGGSYQHRIVEPFLLGLLPDTDEAKVAMARQIGGHARDPVSLLARAGLDCAGAVQFVHPDHLPERLGHQGALVRLDDAGVAARLAEVRRTPQASWVAPEGRWSLAGAQAKIALRLGDDGCWYEPTGSEPTTHILKPGIAGFADQALNEHVCLDTARRLGLLATRTSFAQFDDESAIVVQRYDRRMIDRKLTRVHQEDLCQALSVRPENKYETDGGPSAVNVIRLLATSGSATDREANTRAFVAGLVFNYLIGAPDAHAKNYSVLLSGPRVRLAPLYDIASVLPYDRPPDSWRGPELAMAIAGKRTIDDITVNHWVALAREARLDQERIVEELRDQALRLPDALSDSLSSPGIRSAASELRKRFLDPVAKLCRRNAAVFTSGCVGAAAPH